MSNTRALSEPEDAARSAATPLAALPIRHRLSTRIIVLSLIALFTVLSMISVTLWLSWQLEGAGAAINDAGSLRMRANRVAIELVQAQRGYANALPEQVALMEQTLERLRHGNPTRPLFLPNEPAIHAQLDRVAGDWAQRMKPAAYATLNASPETPSPYVVALPDFVEQANQLVLMIEHDNAEKTRWLRLSQLGLAVLACVGTIAVIYLLYQWIILPVMRLQDGLHRMAAREFSLRLPVESRNEFGTLAQGFNRMASQLQGVYRDLEARVEQKTAELARQNRDLETLYDMTAFLNLPSDTETMCRGFLERVMHQFDAQGGSVRVADTRHGKLHLLVSIGLTEALIETERRLGVNDCPCGTLACHPQPATEIAHIPNCCCQCDGQPGVAMVPIATPHGILGAVVLHLREAVLLPASDRQLLETLGQHLGVALEHLRLSATARQLAVVEERNLVAQGLHDSIAQGLNFLNLQVQLLDAAVARNDLGETREIIPLLRCGVEESYQDVRELLLNFRTKLAHGDFHQAVEDTVARFRRQSGTTLTLSMDSMHDSLPLEPEQQLQVLFILQEALSNVRKHAHAENASVAIHDGADFELVVQDDGEGFEPELVAQHQQAHVGLHIMQERAMRLSAQLTIEAQPGRGTRVALTVPRTP